MLRKYSSSSSNVCCGILALALQGIGVERDDLAENTGHVEIATVFIKDSVEIIVTLITYIHMASRALKACVDFFKVAYISHSQFLCDCCVIDKKGD